MDVAANHRKALFFKGNNLYICDFPCTKASLEENINLSDMVAPIDYSQDGLRYSMKHGGLSVTDSIWKICMEQTGMRLKKNMLY